MNDGFEFNTPSSGGNNSNFQNYGGAPVGGSPGLAIASLVLGLIGLLVCWCFSCVQVIVAIIGLVLGGVSLMKGNRGKGMAIAGVVLSGIALLVGIGLFIVGLIWGNAFSSWYLEFLEEMMYYY
ncbi:MAG: DUF4190 domain-containing protein [Clostridiales bacterium]|jgi:hypothetical protein|nr:DUF4190 domain-containing protein [Clostridiales bacterium]